MNYLIALHDHHVLHQLLPPERPDSVYSLRPRRHEPSHIHIPARWTNIHSQNAVQRHVLNVKFYGIFVSFICYSRCRDASCQLLINEYSIRFYNDSHRFLIRGFTAWFLRSFCADRQTYKHIEGKQYSLLCIAYKILSVTEQ